jgi:hypothetical protein
MSNQVVPFAGGKVPAALRDVMTEADDLSAGVTGGFAVMSFKGSRWKIKYQGEEHPILNSDGDPVASLEAVILKANPHITKNYYATGYTEGAAEAPDCFSLDGLRPDPSVEEPQADTCARCPKNVFGSRITPAGKKAKACQDNRRLAIVPAADLTNETFGGPMLLRIPAASLAELAMMGKNLKARGFPYNAVTVRIGFDIDASYPKLTFRPIRPLTDEEAVQVRELLHDDKLERILAEAVELRDAPAEPEEKKDDLFEQPVAAAKPTAAAPKAAAPKAAAKPAAAKPAAAKPAAKPAAVAGDGDLSGDASLDDDIKGILSELGDLS